MGQGYQCAYGRPVNGNPQLVFPVAGQFSEECITVPTDKMRIVFDLQNRF